MIFKNNFFKSVLFAVTLGLSGTLVAAPVNAAGGGNVEAELQKWSFAGLFGTYDENQLQRGFQIFREICSSCHGAKYLAFRNLSEVGGPGFSEAQVKTLAAEYIILDPEIEAGERAAVPADHWPEPFETELDARGSNNGAFPPDLSVMAKARGISQKFPIWAFNYFTAYQEGGPDYIYNLLVNYHEAPEHTEVPDGQYWNDFFGGPLSMSPPLDDGYIEYEGEGNGTVPLTTEQYAKDVSAFMMWMADPHLNSRKQMGFRTLTFLFLLAGMMYLVKRKIWSNVEH